MDIEYFSPDNENSGRNRTPSVFSSRPESPTDSTDERQMLLDVEQNIANLEKTLSDGRRPDDDYGGSKDNGGGGSSGKTNSKKLFSSFGSDKEEGKNDRKRWANGQKNGIMNWTRYTSCIIKIVRQYHDWVHSGQIVWVHSGQIIRVH